jgi:perosamine synthetase
VNKASEGLAEIPVFRPGFGKAELDAMAEVFASGWLGPGPRTAALEEAFAEYVGAPYAVSVTSCTAALHLTCRALGLGPGDEVLTPSLTFASSAHAALYCGADVVFVDVDPVNCNLDPDDLGRKISPRSKAVIVVHYGGHPAEMDRIWEIAEAHGLKVIEDAAHACGGRYRGNPIGGLGLTAATCFSFNALKNLSTGDGGMITTSSSALADKARQLRWLGIEKNTFERTPAWGSMEDPGAKETASYQWFYEIQDLGYKYAMNDVVAALGLVQLRTLDSRQQLRRTRAAAYSEALSQLEWLALPQEQEYATSAWHLYPVRTSFRDSLKEHLRNRGIATSVHYYPLHLQPFYRRLYNCSLRVTELLGKSLLTIPFHPNLTPREVDRVLESIREFQPSS